MAYKDMHTLYEAEQKRADRLCRRRCRARRRRPVEIEAAVGAELAASEDLLPAAKAYEDGRAPV